LEIQIEYLKQGIDVVSSDFCYVDENNNVTQYLNIVKYGSISDNLKRGHNVIAHPAVGISKNFWMDNENRYDINKTPEEDKDLWQRSIQRGYKFHIIDDILLYYRIHNNQITSISNTESIKEEIKKIESVETKVKIQQQIIHNTSNIIDRCRFCGEQKNKVKYNFCQRCNKIY
jgi:hypothetical protein